MLVGRAVLLVQRSIDAPVKLPAVRMRAIVFLTGGAVRCAGIRGNGDGCRDRSGHRSRNRCRNVGWRRYWWDLDGWCSGWRGNYFIDADGNLRTVALGCYDVKDQSGDTLLGVSLAVNAQVVTGAIIRIGYGTDSGNAYADKVVLGGLPVAGGSRLGLTLSGGYVEAVSRGAGKLEQRLAHAHVVRVTVGLVGFVLNADGV